MWLQSSTRKPQQFQYFKVELLKIPNVTFGTILVNPVAMVLLLHNYILLITEIICNLTISMQTNCTVSKIAIIIFSVYSYELCKQILCAGPCGLAVTHQALDLTIKDKHVEL